MQIFSRVYKYFYRVVVVLGDGPRLGQVLPVQRVDRLARRAGAVLPRAVAVLQGAELVLPEQFTTDHCQIMIKLFNYPELPDTLPDDE